MIDIVLLNKYWGSIDLHICLSKIDILPRMTLSDIRGVLILNVGFLMLSMNLAVYDKEFREFNRRREEERNQTEQ